MQYIKAIVFFLILMTLVSQLCQGDKYKPYIRLVTGFMLLALMMRPIAYVMNIGPEDLTVFSNVNTDSTESSFRSQALETYKNREKKKIKKILQSYKIQAKEVEVDTDDTNDDPEIDEISVKVEDEESEAKKVKTILLNFYNVDESHINISE